MIGSDRLGAQPFNRVASMQEINSWAKMINWLSHVAAWRRQRSRLNKIQFSALALHKLDCWIFSWLRCVSSSSLAAGINWRRSNFMQFNGLENISHSKSLLTDASAFFACLSIKSDKFWRVLGFRPALWVADALSREIKLSFFFESRNSPTILPARQLALAQQFFFSSKAEEEKNLCFVADRLPNKSIFGWNYLIERREEETS